MYKSGGSYSRREIELDVIGYVDDALADPDTSFSVALLIGSRLHGIRALLVQGVIARLRERDPAHAGPVRCEGSWEPVGEIQFCVSGADVPPDPPPPGSVVRILLVACFDLDALPEWMSGTDAPHTRTLPIGLLSHVEAHEFIEARLEGAVEPHSAHTLAAMAGYTPHALTVIVDECRNSGTLAVVDGTWVVVGDPVQSAVVPYLRAQLVTAGERVTRGLLHLALTEPCPTDGLPPEALEVASMLLGDGEMRRRDDGRIEFTARASGEGLRRLAPAGLRDGLHRRSLESAEPGVHALRWAAATGHPVPPQVLEAAAERALADGEWQVVADLAAAVGEPPGPAETAAWCRLLLHGATALRFLARPAEAHALLDRVDAAGAILSTELSPGPETTAPGLHADILALRADVMHFADGEPGAALDLLDRDAPDPAHRDELTFPHLVHSGAVADALRSPLAHGSPADTRDRVATARTLLLTAAGRPRDALRVATDALAPGGPAAPGHGRPRWVEDELSAARTVAALASDGPAAHPLREAHAARFERPDPHPDLVRIHHTRAERHYSCGDIARAHRHASLAVVAARTRDPVGLDRAATALLAETSALLGEHAAAIAALDRFARITPRASAALAGASQSHLAAARLAVGTTAAGDTLRHRAAEFSAAGAHGFAAELLYAGVRFGRRRAAGTLIELSDHLDGTVHELRIRHASALLSRDAVELVVVVDLLHHAGLHLYAAEAAATAARLPSAPTSARRRATHHVATYLAEQPLPGHPLLGRVTAPGAAPLTPREREITALIDAGLSNAEIADRLTLSLSTVEGHITRIYRKTGGTRRAPARR